MRRAQNRRSQLPQRYCLIDTNRNNLSSKSWRRDRLIRLLLQCGHVITRKRLYSLIEWAQISILVYRLSPQKRRPQSRLSRKVRRWERAIIVLLQRRHLMMVIRRSSHSLAGSLRTLSCPSRFDDDSAIYPQILSLRCAKTLSAFDCLPSHVFIMFPFPRSA